MRKTPQRNFVTGFDSLSQSVIVRKRLALEYNRSSGAVCVVEWGYSEAHSFSNKANWYVGTITLDYWFSIHGHFFIVDSIGIFTNGHYDSLIIVLDSYSTIVIVIGYSSIESFSECADRNHRSPSIVNIWSCIHFEELLVNNILRRTDGHGYFVMSSDINITRIIFKSSCIEATIGIIFNSNYNISGGSIRSINSNSTTTVGYIAIKSVYRYNCIFITLICNICGNYGSFNLCASTVFFYNRYGYIIIFTYRAFSWIKFKTKSIVRINNS